jgi:hypothetical protein
MGRRFGARGETCRRIGGWAETCRRFGVSACRRGVFAPKSFSLSIFRSTFNVPIVLVLVLDLPFSIQR